MASTPITELDFFAIKEQLKTYLKSQSAFRDYNFEGSNMNVLLDVLSYNTFQNNYYTNMAINEMFLDSAMIENSVVSHAKELNYLPRSRTSAKAIVRLSWYEVTTAQVIIIPKGTYFSSVTGSEIYNFTTNKDYIARNIGNNQFVADNVEIFEGELLTGFNKEGFFGSSEDGFKAVLNNDNVDINSIEVFVDDETVEYFFRKDIYGVNAFDTVFYVEPYADNRYAVVFGQNTYGRQPTENEDIKISYRICSGEAPNGVSRFSTSFRTNVEIETIQAASGGQEKESIESIKFFAPKSIQIQERAITTTDYEVLLRQRFSDIESISVYGGEELDPPQFGKIAISLNLTDNTVLSNTKRSEFQRYLADKTALAIEPIFVDPKFIYAEIMTTVNYSVKFLEKNNSQIETLVRTAIENYTDDNLKDFGSILRASKLSSVIDNSDNSIQGNKLVITPIIHYVPQINTQENPIFNFQTQLLKPYPYSGTSGFKDFKPAIRSSVFSYRNICAILQDDGNGNMRIISSDIVNPLILNPSIGTVDYTTGVVKLVNFITNGFNGNQIKIYANTSTNDVRAPNDRILLVRPDDISITVVESL